MTGTPSILGAWSRSAEHELARLLENARTTGHLTQHELVRAFPDLELTPEVLQAIAERCRAAGIALDMASDLPDLLPELQAVDPVLAADVAGTDGRAPGTTDGSGGTTVAGIGATADVDTRAGGSSPDDPVRHRRLVSAALRRRHRLQRDGSEEKGGTTSDPVRL